MRHKAHKNYRHRPTPMTAASLSCLVMALLALAGVLPAGARPAAGHQMRIPKARVTKATDATLPDKQEWRREAALAEVYETEIAQARSEAKAQRKRQRPRPGQCHRV